MRTQVVSRALTTLSCLARAKVAASLGEMQPFAVCDQPNFGHCALNISLSFTISLPFAHTLSLEGHQGGRNAAPHPRVFVSRHWPQCAEMLDWNPQAHGPRRPFRGASGWGGSGTPVNTVQLSASGHAGRRHHALRRDRHGRAREPRDPTSGDLRGLAPAVAAGQTVAGAVRLSPVRHRRGGARGHGQPPHTATREWSA
jgi:hypothetical protein